MNKLCIYVFVAGFLMSLSNKTFANSDQEDIPWNQLSTSVKIQAYVNAIAYEQTDLLCYSYGKLMSDLKHNSNYTNVSLSNVNHAHGKTIDDLPRNSSFNKHFFSDAQFRRSIREWLFFHSDALNQAVKNSDLAPREQAIVDEREAQKGWWGKMTSFLIGFTEQNTHSLSARYTHYVTYLVESSGFDLAIRHCALKNSLDQDELKEAMANTLRVHNRNAGIATGVVGLAALAYTGYKGFTYALKGLVLLGRGMQSLWRLRTHLYRRPTKGSSTSQVNSAEQQVVRQEMQKLTQQTHQFQTFVSSGSSKVVSDRASQWTAGDLATELAVEAGFVLYFAHEMAGNMLRNQDQMPERNVPAHRQRALGRLAQSQMIDPYSRMWWGQRLQDYEILINRGLQSNYLEQNSPHQQATLKERRKFQAIMDFYLPDYPIIQREIEIYREKVVDLEKQIEDICPWVENPNFDKSLLGNDPMASSFYHSNAMKESATYRCRMQNQAQIQELQQQIFDAKNSNSYRILRTVLPLFDFRKGQLERALENTEPQLADRVLFELLEVNRNNAYGLCFASLSTKGYEYYQSDLCEFHFLNAKSFLTDLDNQEAYRLEDISQTIGHSL